MTFTTSIKEEISKNDLDIMAARCELEAFFKCSGKIGNQIVITLENASVARHIYKNIKKVYDIVPQVTIRNQRRFRVKQIYILTIKEKIDFIKNDIYYNKTMSPLSTDEEMISFLLGAFLAIGNVSNPQTSGYHLEFVCNNISMARVIKKLLQYFKLNAKIVDRGYKHVVYLKSSENISDLIKMFKASSALFFFEDIRIYRDHKNMVNRLNNCEISNQTRSLENGLKQLDAIKYIKENNLLSLLDENTLIVLNAREKYPELSYTELANVISLEYNYQIGKSGVNHHFIKINNIVKRHRMNNENK